MPVTVTLAPRAAACGEGATYSKPLEGCFFFPVIKTTLISHCNLLNSLFERQCTCCIFNTKYRTRPVSLLLLAKGELMLNLYAKFTESEETECG